MREITNQKNSECEHFLHSVDRCFNGCLSNEFRQKSTARYSRRYFKAAELRNELIFIHVFIKYLRLYQIYKVPLIVFSYYSLLFRGNNVARDGILQIKNTRGVIQARCHAVNAYGTTAVVILVYASGKIVLCDFYKLIQVNSNFLKHSLIKMLFPN